VGCRISVAAATRVCDAANIDSHEPAAPHHTHPPRPSPRCSCDSLELLLITHARSHSMVQNRSRPPCSTASCAATAPSTGLKQLMQWRTSGTHGAVPPAGKHCATEAQWV
jgi:hypothetical protein